MDRRSLLVGFLAGGWIVTLVGLTDLSPFRSAKAQDAGPPSAGGRSPLPPDPVTPNPPGRTVNVDTGTGDRPRGVPNPGANTAAWNSKAIALAGSVGGGESVIYYFDTEFQRLLVYQYRVGEKGGIRLAAARHMDYDLRLEAYRDLSDRSRDELKADYEQAFGAAGGLKPSAELPVKKVDLQPGK